MENPIALGIAHSILPYGGRGDPGTPVFAIRIPVMKKRQGQRGKLEGGLMKLPTNDEIKMAKIAEQMDWQD
jgi:hypothetical protein